MRSLTLTSFLLVTGIALTGLGDARADAPIHSWSTNFGDASAQTAYGVATDASGNIVVTGTIQGTVNFGGGDLTSGGGYDVFIAKFDASGNHQWSQRFGDVLDQSPAAVATDAAGNIYVTGRFNGNIDFGGGNLAAGGDAVFLAKFNSAGAHLWSQRFGDGSAARASSMAVDASNNVIIGGYFFSVINFGGGNLTSAGNYDVFLAKFNSGGTHQWSGSYGDVDDQQAASVAVDAAGSVVVTGNMEGTMDFGGGNLTSAGGLDIFLAKLDAGGTHQWSQRFGDTASIEQGYAVAIDASDNVILGGNVSGSVDFGGGTLVSTGGVDVFVAKFTTGGTHVWSALYGNNISQFLNALAVDASGNITVCGQYSGTINFGGGDLTTVGSSNMYLASLTPSGAHRFSQRYGDGSMYPYALTHDPSKNVIAAGGFNTSVNFGGSTLTSSGIDIYLAKFSGATPEPEIIDIVDVGNDQGRKVRIRFAASGHDDAGASVPIEQYEAYLRSDPTPSAMAQPASLLASGAQQIPGWGFVAAVPAHAESEYELYAPTLADSTVAQGQYYSVFFIRAATGTPSLYYDSPPDSGYSLDNLAPGVPTSFAYSAGTLTWDESTAPDFDYFSVYGSNSNTFGSAILIDYTVSPTMDVMSSSYNYFFVTATDFSGNEGVAAALDVATGVGETPRQYVLSISAYPNPFNPNTMVRYTVPSKGLVDVSVYDVRGARVAILVNAWRDVGAYTEGWDGVDAGGNPVSSGIYFARVSHPSGTMTYKLVLLK